MNAHGKILIVDDEAGIRESLGSILRDEALHVDAVESAEAGLERIAAGGFDVVLLDVWLPGIDGMEALTRIQESGQRARGGHDFRTRHDRNRGAGHEAGCVRFYREATIARENYCAGAERDAAAAAGSGKRHTAQRVEPPLPGAGRQRADESAAAANCGDCAEPRPRADLWRKRNRQGTGGARAACGESAAPKDRSWK